MSQITVAAFYQFAPFANFHEHQEPLLSLGQSRDVYGTILLASEGINGTIAGPADGVDAVLSHIKAMPGFADLEWKTSFADENPFHRLKIRLKKEIVTMGVGDIAPHESKDNYVEPTKWNQVISEPGTIVIDARNDYEVAIGSFEGAVNPHTTSFRDFPKWFEDFRSENEINKVAMYCTGGIRCEKSVALLKAAGVQDVVHLKGGILKYLETVSEDESLWQGECFVFDNRVSVQHDLTPGSYDLCHACRRPITQEDKTSADFVRGVSCPHCIGDVSDESKKRFAERQKQVDLAAARGEAHIGGRPTRSSS